MYEYNFDMEQWTTIDSQGETPSGRSSLVSQVCGNSLFVFGGYNGQVVLNDFYEMRFEPVAIQTPV